MRGIVAETAGLCDLQIGILAPQYLRMKSALVCCGIFLSALGMSAAGQSVPNAGSLQQQIERQRPQAVPSVSSPEKLSAPAPMAPSAGPLVQVSQFRFIGNTLINAEQLGAVVAGFLNQALDFKQLQLAATAVANAYRDAGWVVRAYLPQQDIQNGVVRIQIVEANFGKVQHEGTPARRISPAQVDQIFAAHQKPGEFANAYALDRALLLADDLPGISLVGSLTAGASDGETDLALTSADEPWIQGEAATDNFGARSTGSDRLTASLELRSPFRLGDLLTSNLIQSRGNDYLRLAYTVPIGGKGWRVGADTSHLRYTLVGSDFSTLKAQGTSSSSGLEASYPLVRSRRGNLYLDLRYKHSRFENQSLGNVSSNYNIKTASIGLNGNRFDPWGGGGITSASLNWHSGQRDDKLNSTRDRFSKLAFGLSRQQVVSPSVSFHAAISGQTSHSTLDSSEKLYLGGANGVRAYPANEGAGSSGLTSSVEVRWRVEGNVSLAAFYDFGRVNNNDGSPSYSLKGSGLWLGLQSHAGAYLKAIWAHRLGENPNPTSAGLDQDGSLDKDRWWLSAQLPF
jgi:hemolysin activation/secretion protein